MREALAKMKTGDVVTFKGTGWAAWLVRWWTRQPVAHVGFILWLRFGNETEDRACVLHSHPTAGIQINPLSDFKDQEMEWMPFIGDGNEAVGYALHQWGKRYASIMQFLWMLSPMARHIFNVKLKKDGRYHCSQLVSEAIEFCGAELPKEPADMSPGDLRVLRCFEKPTPIDWSKI